MGTMRNLVPRVTLELLGLDCVTTKEDVENALRQDIEGIMGDAEVSLTKPNRRKQVTAIVQTNEQEAKKLVDVSRMKVGCINSKIRRRTLANRCSK